MKEKSIQFHNAVTLQCYACDKITTISFNNRPVCPDHIATNAPARATLSQHRAKDRSAATAAGGGKPGPEAVAVAGGGAA